MPTLNELAALTHPPGTLAASTSLFASATSTVVESVVSLKTVLRGIRDGQWAAEIADVRAAIHGNDKERAGYLKRRLPAFTASAVLRTRARDHGDRLITHSGWVQADFDGKDNPGLLQADARESLMADPHTGAVFIGPSGSGIKALVRILPEQHTASVEAAIVYFRDTHGLHMDEKCRDIERLCFVSHDPEAWIREDNEAQALPLPPGGQPSPLPASPRPQEAPRRIDPWAIEDVREVLSFLKGRPDYDTWLRVISGVASVLPMAEAMQVLQEWRPAEKPGEYEAKWRHRLENVTIRSVIRMAQAHGFDAVAAARRQRWMGRVRIAGKPYGPGSINADLLQPDIEPDMEDPGEVWEALTNEQYGDATIFARKMGARWKHDELAQRWRRYNPATGLWEKDLAGTSMLVARTSIIASYAGMEETVMADRDTAGKLPGEKQCVAEIKAMDDELKKIRARITNLGRSAWCTGVMNFAARIPMLNCRATDFDQSRHLLAMKNGILDFKDGRIIEFSPQEMLASGAPVEYIPDATCPHFSAFLLARMGGDEELVAYLWRLIGYSLTGFVDHDALFLCYGTGSNGKSTLFKILERLLGPQLAISMDISVLLGGSNETGSTVDYKKANLEGKRLVLASETPEGKPLNEAMVKQLLGGESIQARRLYEMPYSFAPTHKIWVGTNHKPNIKGTDHGIWRRIHLIPWLQKIPVEEQRPRDEMVEFYCLELPGILNRAIEGYVDFLNRNSKLCPPASVLAATEEYRQDEDGLGNYLAENTEPAPLGMIKLTELLEHYLDWCKSAREVPVASTVRKLAAKLKDRSMQIEPYGTGGTAHLFGRCMLTARAPKIKEIPAEVAF